MKPKNFSMTSKPRNALFALVVIAASVPGLASAAVETYVVDASHSDVSFAVRHFVAKSVGRFDKFEGTIQIDPENPASLQVSAKIPVASVNTNNDERDNHLKSPDFFAAEKHPEILFQSKKAKKNGDKVQLVGDITIRGVTKEITLDVEVLGFAPDAWGGHRAGFEAKGKLDRKDFGIEWNKALDKGGFVLGDDVDITLRIEAVRK